ncbi:hypothetical protein OIU84_028055, partial [Salix udensis]
MGFHFEKKSHNTKRISYYQIKLNSRSFKQNPVFYSDLQWYYLLLCCTSTDIGVDSHPYKRQKYCLELTIPPPPCFFYKCLDVGLSGFWSSVALPSDTPFTQALFCHDIDQK